MGTQLDITARKYDLKFSHRVSGIFFQTLRFSHPLEPYIKTKSTKSEDLHEERSNMFGVCI